MTVSVPPVPAAPTSVEAFRASIVRTLQCAVGKDAPHARPRDWYVATALATRDHVVEHWMAATRRTYDSGAKRVYYLSMEFLIGRQLMEALGNLGLTGTAREALHGLGISLDELRTVEPDPGLGNGGLGRLAACFMESMASLQVPAYGYGIRYDHGIFRQVIRDGWQFEMPEEWLSTGFPWEFERPEVTYTIHFGGTVTEGPDAEGRHRTTWTPAEGVRAVAYDTPITGWRGAHVNTLRLWSARAMDPISLADFHKGDHVGALADRVRLEAISRILYPADDTPAGTELRLRQEIFFASASLQDIVRRHLRQFGDLRTLPERAAIQLNDTHPVIGIPELMRLLVDVHDLPWEEAWRITRGVFHYTNHTLLPEALETWSVALLEQLLPRHLQILRRLDAEQQAALQARGVPPTVQRAVALLGERGHPVVRMGNVAFLTARKVNGVSALHTDLMRETVFRDFHQLHPDRIVNKTNGITFRRWLLEANPGLTATLVEAIGPGFIDDPTQLHALAALADDRALQTRLAAVRQANKVALATQVERLTGVRIDPAACLDVQIKRIHEYKRQLLNLVEIVARYQAILDDPTADWVPQVRLFGGKAFPTYQTAKLIVKLASDIARVVNADPVVGDRLKVVFVPNYNVSLAEAIVPAADVSEQISTAGMEASGTGNMKLALNGALTLGTLDGANVEMQERIGAEHLVIFGLTAEEVVARRKAPAHAEAAIAASPALGRALDAVAAGHFSPDDPSRYRALIGRVRSDDYFLVCSDFEAYRTAHAQVADRWRTPATWWRHAIHATAGMGWFSSDRTIREYAAEIWGVPVRG
ncbi:MAG: hypothetical protein RLZZ25_795 [Gemmatimonadota bacterium]